MVVATLIASSLIVAPFDMLEISKDGASAALYISNIVFGFKAQNYFASNINKSPFLHTWSLGVEEQFYLVWPFVVYAALLMSRRTGIFVRRLALPIFAIILATSFAVNVALTNSGSSWAFFSLPTRAWEFALGGLIASIAVRNAPSWSGLLLGLTGLAAIVYADLTFNDLTSYPGTNAVWPVAGAGLLILAGQMVDSSNPTVVMRALALRPMKWVGRLSYSWYLWHWPLIILAVLVIGNDSVVCSNKRSSYLARPGIYRIQGGRESASIQSVTQSIFMADVSGRVGDYRDDLGDGWRGMGHRARSTPASYGELQSAALKVFFPVFTPAKTPRGISYYSGGDLSSRTVVALVGDSHAATWFNELSLVAARQHVRLAAFMRSGCPFIPIVVKPAIPNAPTSTAQCLVARAQGMQGLRELKPVGVILSDHDRQYLGLILNKNGNVPSEPVQIEMWRTAFKTFLGQMQDLGIRPAVILDDPTLPYEPAECVSRTQSLAACEATREAALSIGEPLMRADLGVLKTDASVPVLAPANFLCDKAGCPLELHGHLLYADTNHLTLGATQLMEPQLSNLLTSVLGRG